MHDLVRTFKDAGGEAIELRGCRQLNAFEMEYPSGPALEFGLYSSRGTDYHRDGKVPLGTRYVFDERLSPVWKHPTIPLLCVLNAYGVIMPVHYGKQSLQASFFLCEMSYAVTLLRMFFL